MTTIWKAYEAEGVAHHLPHVRDGHKCKNLHGHNMTIVVEVESSTVVDGMVCDYEVLDAIMAKHILPWLDHKLANDWCPNPTSENLAMYAHDVFMRHLPEHLRVHENVRVEVRETEHCGARYP